VQPKITKEQADLISSMHSRPNNMARPHTAATTNVYDESRIKNKLKFLEDIEAKIELDIERIQDGSENKKKGVRLNK
jgi:hypothetical protein